MGGMFIVRIQSCALKHVDLESEIRSSAECSTGLKFSLRDFCTLLRFCGRCARSGAATQPGATATPGRPPANGSTLQTNRILCGYSFDAHTEGPGIWKWR